MKTILITGAAGDVATHLRRELAGKYALRLSDIKPVKKPGPNESFRTGDVARLSDIYETELALRNATTKVG